MESKKQKSLVDDNKVQQVAGAVVSDLAAAYAAVMTDLGRRLGLYRALDGAGPLSPEQLAQQSGTHARLVREWLNSQVCGGYLTCRAGEGTYELPAVRAASPPLPLAPPPSPPAGTASPAQLLWPPPPPPPLKPPCPLTSTVHVSPGLTARVPCRT